MSKIKEKSKKVVVTKGWELPSQSAPIAWKKGLTDSSYATLAIIGALSIGYFIYKLIIN